VNKQVEAIQKKKDEQNQRKLESMSEKQSTPASSTSTGDIDIMAEMKKIMDEMQEMRKEHEEIVKEKEVVQEKLEHVIEENKQIEEVLQSAGIYDKAAIKTRFEQLRKDDHDRYDYAKAFYWTILNRFDAYRLASTGAFKVNNESTVEGKEGLAAGAAHVVLGLASAIPVIGSFFKMFDDAVTAIHGKIKENRYEQRMNSIVSIIMKNNDPKAQLKEEQSMMLAKAALEIADRKKDVFEQKR
jgi:hypothetical protein